MVEEIIGASVPKTKVCVHIAPHAFIPISWFHSISRHPQRRHARSQCLCGRSPMFTNGSSGIVANTPNTPISSRRYTMHGSYENHHRIHSIALPQHEITGRAMLRINDSSLMRMGIVSHHDREAIWREIVKQRLKTDIMEARDLEYMKIYYE